MTEGVTAILVCLTERDTMSSDGEVSEVSGSLCRLVLPDADLAETVQALKDAGFVERTGLRPTKID